MKLRRKRRLTNDQAALRLALDELIKAQREIAVLRLHIAHLTAQHPKETPR